MNPRRKGYGAGENQNSAWMDGVRKALNDGGLTVLGCSGGSRELLHVRFT